ncbi:hypothetical protein [Nocardioides sp.]|uniref:hypothetical protein n=1 Tax=Nocardioides sp. TaxID=35761 RepID=UPI003D0E8A30
MDPRLRAAVDESVCWYDELFALHGVGCGIVNGLWTGHGTPPPLHSAAKTVEPSVPAGAALAAVEAHEHCSVADSFGDLDADGAMSSELDLMFEARWLHHPPLDRTRALPTGWAPVTTATALAQWTARHDTTDVLLPGLLERSAFGFLCLQHDGEVVAGAVTHLCAGVVSVSNVWGGPQLDWAELLRVVADRWPDRAIVGYERGSELSQALEAGFSDVGPQLVWMR